MNHDVLRYPSRGPHAEGAFVRGLICVFATVVSLEWFPSPLSIISVPTFLLLLGYLLTVQIAGLHGSDSVPRFDRYSMLLVRGIVTIAVSIVYLIVPAIILGITVQGTQVSGGRAISFQTGIALVFGSTLVLVLALVAVYLLPVAVSKAVNEGSLRASMHIDSIRRDAVQRRYLVTWFVGLCVVLFVPLLTGVFWEISRILSAVVLGIGYYAIVSVTHAVGSSLT